MSRTYFVETIGCQMNVHDAERMAGLLEAAGYRSAATAEQADVVVVNTCSVREKAEEKLFSRLGELRRPAGPRRLLVVAGCVAQQEGAALRRRAPHVDVVVGTRAEHGLARLVERAWENGRAQVETRPLDEVSFPLGLARRADPVRAYVTIVEGCNDACTYCVVPFTRGPERMRPRAEILDEVRLAAGEGRREVCLLGQIVNAYRAPDDAVCDFAGLLEAVHEVPGIQRIRFASPHPRHVTPRLIRTLASLPHVCRHLHLPVQSGSTRLLRAMKRRHTREAYLGLVARLREAMPDLALSTDMIVGFPGETIADFEETLSLTRKVRFQAMFSFKYSPRPNTLAARRLADDVQEAEKRKRLDLLQGLQREVQTAMHETMVGRRVEVLIDGVSRRRGTEVTGRTPGNTAVNLPGETGWVGRLAEVLIRRAGPNSLWGEATGAMR